MIVKLLQLYKKRLQHRCFPVNVAKLFKSTYYTSGNSCLTFTHYPYPTSSKIDYTPPFLH